MSKKTNGSRTRAVGPSIKAKVMYEHGAWREKKQAEDGGWYEALHVKCYWCGLILWKKITTIDHVIPTSKGGGNEIENLVPSCADCNVRRGNKI